jgi:hypothetical protein
MVTAVSVGSFWCIIQHIAQAIHILMEEIKEKKRNAKIKMSVYLRERERGPVCGWCLLVACCVNKYCSFSWGWCLSLVSCGTTCLSLSCAIVEQKQHFACRICTQLILLLILKVYICMHMGERISLWKLAILVGVSRIRVKS